MSDGSVKLRLLFVDDGDYREEEFEVPAGAIEGYDRLIDYILEDADVLKRLHVDTGRLCAVFREDD